MKGVTLEQNRKNLTVRPHLPHLHPTFKMPFKPSPYGIDMLPNYCTMLNIDTINVLNKSQHMVT